MTDDGDDDGIFVSSSSRDPQYSAVFEYDGEVAYGYLLSDGQIVSDVWLYNSDDTGSSGVAAVSNEDEVSIVWVYGQGSASVAVEFWIRGTLQAGISVA